MWKWNYHPSEQAHGVGKQHSGRSEEVRRPSCMHQPSEAESLTPERTLSVTGTGGTDTGTSWDQSFF